MATISLTTFVDRVFVEKTPGIIYLGIVEILWVTYSYFERPVLLFFSILIFLTIIILMYALGDSILRRVVSFLRSNVDDRYVGCDVTDVYYLDFLIGIILNKMTFLSVL